MQFFVIERFRKQDGKAIYGRFRQRGRMTPEGLTFLDSWVTADSGPLLHADGMRLWA